MFHNAHNVVFYARLVKIKNLIHPSLNFQSGQTDLQSGGTDYRAKRSVYTVMLGNRRFDMQHNYNTFERSFPSIALRIPTAHNFTRD